MASNLTASEFFRVGRGRVDIFLDLLKKDHVFETVTGERIRVQEVRLDKKDVYPPHVPELAARLKALEEKYLRRLFRVHIEICPKNKPAYFFPISRLKKTSEFGGKVRGFSTRIEDYQLKKLQERIEELKNLKSVDFLNLRLNGNIYLIDFAETTPGTPKSDFQLIDTNGGPSVYISHKAGNKPTHIQQWSGMTEPRIRNHPEVRDFVSAVKGYYTVMPRATTIAKKIYSPELKNLSMYGRDYGMDFGINNVNVILQGNVDLRDSLFGYFFEAHHVMENGNPVLEQFEPTLMAIYKGNTRKDFGLPRARFTIQPYSGRKIHFLLDDDYNLIPVL